ncbi:hypothetical protein V6N13_027403 [Hibiscus sabdariffa]
MRNETELQDPPSGYGKMADGACLGGEDPSPLVDFLEPPLGYNKSFNGAEWMCGCSSFVTESGSYKTDQDGCSSVDLLGLDKCGFCRGRGSYMVLTNSGRFCWWPHCYPLTGPLIGLEAPPGGFKRKGGMHGYICGSRLAPSRTAGLGESRTPRCRSKSSHARELGYVLSSIVQPLQQPLGSDMVQDSGLGEGCGKGATGIDVRLLSFSKSHIDTEIEVESVKTRFTGTYGSFDRPRKHLDWELIDSYSLSDGICYSDNRSNSRANTCNKPRLLEVKKLVVGPRGGSAGPPHGEHRSARPYCRRCAPGLNWPGRSSGAVTLKKLECSKQAYACIH